MFIRTPGEVVVFEKKVVYTDSEEDKALLMVCNGSNIPYHIKTS